MSEVENQPDPECTCTCDSHQVDADLPVVQIGQGDDEKQSGEISSRLNWLRAGVLGANDGIVSVAGMVFGVAGASLSLKAVLVSGLAALVAGAISMAAGEYVSVSTQRDTEKAELAHEAAEIAENPQKELEQLAGIFVRRGLTPRLASQVALQLHERDALEAHARYELGIDPDEITRPWVAAFASMVSFVVGALVPLLFMVLSSPKCAVWATLTAVTLCLALTGIISAKLGKAPVWRALVRNVLGGWLAMGITYSVGMLVSAV